MAGGWDRNEAKRLLDASFGKVAYVAPTLPMMLGLYSVVGSETTTGTEVVNAGGSTYARQNLTNALPASSTVGTQPASASITNSVSALTFANMPAIQTVAVESFDSTPRRQSFGNLAVNKTTALGDSLVLNPNQLTYNMA